jgi:protocatechuate 3,4-dioxygenase beta subunit
MHIVIGLFVALTLAQTPARQASAPTARLAGRVTVEGTNAPLADARVVLMPAPRQMPQRPMFPIGPPPQAITDQDGRFAFARLRPGEYRISAQRTGYAPLDDPDQGRTIELADGQAVDDLQIRMQKGAVIAGRILGPSGEPQADVHVMALRRIEGPRMPARLIPAPMQGMQQTNDLGEFRLAGLPPGEYFVSAAPNMQSRFGGPGVALPAAGQSRTTLATTYYPGTTDAAAAQPVAVARGAEVGNISFMLQSLPAFRVSGVVVDEDGKPVGGAFVMLTNDPRNGMFMGRGASRAPSGDDGRFTIDNVVAGTYHANASVPIPMNGGAGAVTTWSSSGGDSSGVTIVTGGVVGGGTTTAVGGVIHQPVEIVVSDADVTGVRIVIRKPQ